MTKPTAERALCTEDGCSDPQRGRGLCNRHYQRQWQREHRLVREPLMCAFCGGPSTRQQRNGLSYCSPVCKGKAYTANGKNSEKARKYYFKSRYGLTVQDVEEMAAVGCAICGTHDWMGRHGGRPHIDHDHETGEVRGLLCHNCNLMIGYAHEDIAVLKAAIRYLSRVA